MTIANDGIAPDPDEASLSRVLNAMLSGIHVLNRDACIEQGCIEGGGVRSCLVTCIEQGCMYCASMQISL